MTPAAPNKQGESRVIVQIGARPHQVTVTSRSIRGKRSIVVEWRELGVRRQWKPPATSMRQAEAEAKAFAKAKHLVLRERSAPAETGTPAPLSWSALVEAYVLGEGQEWAPNTLRNFTQRVRAFTMFFGGTTPATAASLETIDEFRAHLRRLEREPMEINRITTTVKAVFTFGVRRDLLISKVPLYVAKRVKGHLRRRIAEFNPDAMCRILIEMRPRTASGHNEPQRPWRPWAISLLSALSSKRTRSQILPLRKDEIIWHRGGASVHWLAERNKTRTKQVQPMPRRAAALLRLVLWLLKHEGYDGPLMFPAIPTGRVKRKGGHYSYSALVYQLDKACTRAKVSREHGQAMHGFRRYALNTVLEVTGGNLKKAGLYLNDTDMGVLSDYVRERESDQGDVAALMPKPDKPTPAVKKAMAVAAQEQAKQDRGSTTPDGSPAPTTTGAS